VEALRRSLSNYVEHYTRGELAPQVKIHGAIGTLPIGLAEVIQPAGDYSGSVISDLVILEDRSSAVWGDIECGGGRLRYCMRPRSLHVVPPNYATSIVVDDTHEIRAIAIPESFASACLADANGPAEALDFGCLHREGGTSPFATQLIARLWQHVRDPGRSRILVDALVVALLDELRSMGRSARPARGGLARGATQLVIDYIAAHYADDVTLGELAAMVSLSPYHFCRAFKQATGLPPHRYQIMLRIDRARQLLANTTLSIGDVAATVGYNDQSQLARLFQREVGVSPSRYRRERCG